MKMARGMLIVVVDDSMITVEDMQHQIVQTLKKGNFHRRMSGEGFFE